MAKEEEKVLENGREQGLDMGMRAVRDLAVCRGRERGRCALGCSWGEGKGEGISRAKGSMRIRALTAPAPLLPCLTSPSQGQGKEQDQEPHGDRCPGAEGGELEAEEPPQGAFKNP